MGYYTNYDIQVLDIKGEGYNAYDIAKYMQEQNEKSDKFYAFSYGLEEVLEEISPEENNYDLCLASDEETKWYDHEEEMTELSEKFPDILFKLHGEGEDNGDLWNKYFMNGKMQYCKAQIVYPPFDGEIFGISNKNIQVDNNPNQESEEESKIKNIYKNFGFSLFMPFFGTKEEEEEQEKESDIEME